MMIMQEDEQTGLVITVTHRNGIGSRTPHIGKLLEGPQTFEDWESIPGYGISISGFTGEVLEEAVQTDGAATLAQKAFVLAAALYADTCTPTKSDSSRPLGVPKARSHGRGGMAVILDTKAPVAVFAGKKYKKVANRIKPVATTLPEDFRIVRNIVGNPLETLPVLPVRPPHFEPRGRYTLERKKIIDDLHPEGFLWPEERKLMHHFMALHEKGFAWDETEKGHFREDFFPPVNMGITEHIPWVNRNMPIPPGIYDEVIRIVREKVASGAYEPSSSSYRSRWFTVLKKDGKSLRIVHDLQPLNAVTIRDSGMLPFVETLAESFAGRACYGVLDLFVAFDQRGLAQPSRDYTTFQTPLGTFRLTKLPMGWTNSVPILHGDVTYALQDEIPEFTIPFMDDAGIRGPPTRYETKDGGYETIEGNEGIRRFVWEHFQVLGRIVQRIWYIGCTWSGKKAFLCVPEAMLVGHKCTYAGREPDETKMEKVRNWGPCRDLTDVRAFMGTVGLMRVFIWNFAGLSRPLVDLTKKDAEFYWGPEQQEAQDELKAAMLSSPALRPLDYHSGAPIILCVDSSVIAIGYALFQEDEEDARLRYPNRFGSMALNPRETNYSQPKLELYGLYRALKAVSMYIIGARNLVVEVDATAIKGMINNPDLNPNATINRWVAGVLLFTFKLVHVPGIRHGVDGLSRRRPFPGEELEEDDEDWVDRHYGFLQVIASAHVEPEATVCEVLLRELVEVPDYSYDELNPNIQPDATPEIPRSKKHMAQDERLVQILRFLDKLEIPERMGEKERKRFIKYATGFFRRESDLWRRMENGKHQLVVKPPARLGILRSAHDRLGHKGTFSVRHTVQIRFWWPGLLNDIKWYLSTCHECQLRRTQHWHIPPVVAEPAPLFAKAYIDTFFMPPSNGFKYFVHARCSLTAYPEFRMLRKENENTLAAFIFEELICRWGSLREIVTDNGQAFIAAMDRLSRQYGVKHIRISGYNSQANGIIENRHYDVREGLFKLAKGNESKWSEGTFAMMWAERVTISRVMHMSPYRAATGAEPLLPLDFVQATWLTTPFSGIVSHGDVIVQRAMDLWNREKEMEKLKEDVWKSRVDAAKRWEKEHQNRVVDFDFKRGDLVLLENSKGRKGLQDKMQARYFGPLVVLFRTKGGAYQLCELSGTRLANTVAARRVMKYLARERISLPWYYTGALTDEETKRLMESDEKGE